MTADLRAWKGAALAAVLLGPLSALPCEPPPLAWVIVPRHEAQGVPLNASILVKTGMSALHLCEVGPEGVTERAATVEPFRPFVSDVVRLVPVEPLSPLTRYEVVAGADCATALRESASFTTGQEEDTQAPRFSGVQGGSARSQGPSLFPGSCGSTEGYSWYALEMDAPSDDMADAQNIAFFVYASTEPGGTPGTVPRAILPASSRQLTGGLAPDVSPEVKLVVTAVDWAGNESARGEPVVIGAGCGCTSSSGGALLLPLLGVLGLFMRRKPGATSRAA